MSLANNYSPRFEAAKSSALVQSIIIDAIGLLSYAMPGLFEFTDMAVAPLLAVWIWALHRNSVMAAIGLVEELMPFTDVMPTATITWFYRFILNEATTRRSYE